MLKKSNGRKLLMCMSISLSLVGTYTILSPQTIQADPSLNEQGIQKDSQNYIKALKNYNNAVENCEVATNKFKDAQINFTDALKIYDNALKNFEYARNKLEFASANKHFEMQLKPSADDIIATGEKHRRKPFKFGAKTGDTSQFDASSFTQYVYGKHGIKLPRTSVQQATCGDKINNIDNMQKGDLLYFKNPNHVAIYMGDDKMLGARSKSNGVAITKLTKYWKDRLGEIRRFPLTYR